MSGKECYRVEMSVDDEFERVYMNECEGSWMKRKRLSWSGLWVC
jgi:hypothetical protein